MFGKLLALPVRLLNVPMRTVEKAVDTALDEETPKSERALSVPLEALAQVIEEAADGEGTGRDDPPVST